MDFDEDGDDLDPDLLVDMPALPGNSLGDFGFGHSSLDEQEHIDNLDCEGNLANEIATSQLRKKASHHFANPSANSRPSLAFELATALDPDENPRDLLYDLGIEEDPEDEGYYQHEVPLDNDDELFQGKEYRHNSPRSSPLRKAKSSASRASFGPSVDMRHDGLPSTSSSYKDAEPFEGDIEFDSIDFEHGYTNLNDSIAETGAFISRLGDYVSLEDPHNRKVTSQEANVLSDRQYVLERLLNTFIKALYESIRRREEELRTLKELERWMSEYDASSFGPLEEVDQLSSWESFHLSDTPRTLPACMPDHDGPGINPVNADRYTHNTVLYDLPNELSSIRIAGEAITATLASITEHTQVGKAVGTDASRKLKAIRTHFTGIKSESDNVEKSQQYVSEWESREGLVDVASATRQRWREARSNFNPLISRNRSGVTPVGRFSESAVEELNAALSLLESSHDRARVLLTPA